MFFVILLRDNNQLIKYDAYFKNCMKYFRLALLSICRDCDAIGSRANMTHASAEL